MPFFREFLWKKNKKIVTLQVQVPFIKCECPVKRVLSAASEPRSRGSLTIEASLALPLFLFFMVLMMLPMKLMNEGRRIQTALEAAGEEVSQYAYIWEQLKQREGPEDLESVTIPKEFLNILTENGALLYVRKRLEGRVDFKHLEAVSFSNSSVLKDGETIDLVMNYRMKIPFSIFRVDSIPMTARSCRRAWIGREGKSQNGDGQADELVYIGKTSTRYHRDRNCHYLFNDIKTIPFDKVDSARNSSGGKYQPCSRCGKYAQIGGSVYIMPGGEKYHSDRNCSSLAAYVQAVPLSKVRHLGACSYCSQ